MVKARKKSILCVCVFVWGYVCVWCLCVYVWGLCVCLHAYVCVCVILCVYVCEFGMRRDLMCV